MEFIGQIELLGGERVIARQASVLEVCCRIEVGTNRLMHRYQAEYSSRMRRS